MITTGRCQLQKRGDLVADIWGNVCAALCKCSKGSRWGLAGTFDQVLVQIWPSAPAAEWWEWCQTESELVSWPNLVHQPHQNCTALYSALCTVESTGFQNTEDIALHDFCTAVHRSALLLTNYNFQCVALVKTALHVQLVATYIALMWGNSAMSGLSEFSVKCASFQSCSILET